MKDKNEIFQIIRESNVFQRTKQSVADGNKFLEIIKNEEFDRICEIKEIGYEAQLMKAFHKLISNNFTDLEEKIEISNSYDCIKKTGVIFVHLKDPLILNFSRHWISDEFESLITTINPTDKTIKVANLDNYFNDAKEEFQLKIDRVLKEIEKAEIKFNKFDKAKTITQLLMSDIKKTGYFKTIFTIICLTFKSIFSKKDRERFIKNMGDVKKESSENLKRVKNELNVMKSVDFAHCLKIAERYQVKAIEKLSFLNYEILKN